MIERTLTGRSKPRRGSARRGKSSGPAALTNLGPVIWSIALLTFSVALAAAAVFTHKPL